MAQIRKRKIGANDTCPCWSGAKYKKCCRGKVDWPTILAGKDGHIDHLSARGRNLVFADVIYDALQLDTENPPNLEAWKRAFTADAIRKIYEGIYELWPPSTDLKSVLSRNSGKVSGLYIGDYENRYLEQAIVRHCLYADRIVLIDPFVHPHTMRDEFNPILNPDQHRSQTLKNVNRFMHLLPWIDAGLVEFVRTPADLDRELNWNALKEVATTKDDPQWADAIQQTVNEVGDRHRDRRVRQDLLLSWPDAALRSTFRETNRVGSETTEDEFISYIQSERDADPDFLGPIDELGEQLHMMFAGSTVSVARMTAELTGSYLYTDLHARWQMLQQDRGSHSTETRAWSPFSKAVQKAKFSFLNNVDLGVALRLREEGRLASVRRVMRDAWKEELAADEYDEVNAVKLAENLQAAITEAEVEWEKVNSSLTKLSGAQVLAVGAAAGPLIAQGHAQWVAGLTLAAAGTSLAAGLFEKRGFHKRYPASFFMDLSDTD